VGNVILVFLEIYCSLQKWENFANRSRIDKVIAIVRVAPFLTHSVVKDFLRYVRRVPCTRRSAGYCTKHLTFFQTDKKPVM